jgi:DNA-binding Lrp family transcriptional regulator
MDSIDKAILAELQDNFPIEQDPYTIIAKRLGIDVEKGDILLFY